MYYQNRTHTFFAKKLNSNVSKFSLLNMRGQAVLELNDISRERLENGIPFNNLSSGAPHENSRIMYVSNTDGNDTTAQIYGASDFDNPFLPGSNVLPFQDIETAKSHMRDGMGDWILFKKGDTFYDVIGSNKVSGLSPEYPTLYGSYGAQW